MTETPADRMLAEIRDWAATLPTRCPTLLRVGRGVLGELKAAAKPSPILSAHQLLYGVSIVEDDSYQVGEWRTFDQHGDTITFGVLPVPGATVQVEQADGSCTRMRVLAVDRDEHGRIIGYTAADANMLDNPWGGSLPDNLWPRTVPGRLGLYGPAC
jgi:hypothetical protein